MPQTLSCRHKKNAFSLDQNIKLTNFVINGFKNYFLWVLRSLKNPKMKNYQNEILCFNKEQHTPNFKLLDIKKECF